LEEIVRKEPDTLRISLSGFAQKTYQIGHKNGNIESVKKNMITLSKLIKKHRAKINVTVLYLKYKHNLNEISAMKEYASSLGFNFEEFWAYLTPVEMNIQYLEHPEKIDKNTNDIIKLLGFEPRAHLKALEPDKKDRCRLLENQLVLNAAGEIQLCCASVSPVNSTKNYLDLTPQQINDLRHREDLCKKCMKYGIHMVYQTVMDENDLKLMEQRVLRKTI